MTDCVASYAKLVQFASGLGPQNGCASCVGAVDALPGELRVAPHAPSPGWHAFKFVVTLIGAVDAGISLLLVCCGAS